MRSATIFILFNCQTPETVYIRDDEEHYRVIAVQDWIENDESLEGTMGY